LVIDLITLTAMSIFIWLEMIYNRISEFQAQSGNSNCDCARKLRQVINKNSYADVITALNLKDQIEKINLIKNSSTGRYEVFFAVWKHKASGLIVFITKIRLKYAVQ
jgi:hypothetical protein